MFREISALFNVTQEAVKVQIQFRTIIKAEVLVFHKAQDFSYQSLTLLASLLHFPLWLLSCLIIHQHTPSCQRTFAFAISSAFCFAPRHPLGGLSHFLKVLTKCYLPDDIVLKIISSMPTYYFPHLICHIMYLFIFYSYYYLSLPARMQSFMREEIFVSFFHCCIPVTPGPDLNGYEINIW